MKDIIREKLEILPDAPGCYLMKNKNGDIIYVGKALNLKKRVKSYFHGAHNTKTEHLVEKIYDFEIVVVKNEKEALILEANLIKAYKPHYNILMRDDKHYPYLRITLNEDFPRLLIARSAKTDGSRYFGPYPSIGSIHKAKELVHDFFPLRSCSEISFKKEHRSCLNSHINRCYAPCEGKITKEEYEKIVKNVIYFLQGKLSDLIKEQKIAMEIAASEMRFEDAARYRNNIAIMKNISTQQEIDSRSTQENYDIIAVVTDDNFAIVQVFYIRNGAVVNRKHFEMALSEEGGKQLILHRFLQEYYGGGDRIPPSIFVEVLPEDCLLLEKIFSENTKHKIKIKVPQKGAKKRLLNLVKENAKLILENNIRNKQMRNEKNALALEKLKQVLSLKVLPRRIECYDISHIQGSDMVGSMVVFINGVANPKLYRHFRIKSFEGINDFAALQEILQRRWKRGLLELKQKKQLIDFGNFPDLIVIDGGKGQLSSAINCLKELPGEKPNIIALAKQFEEIYLFKQDEPLLLSENDPALLLIQNLRNEAHRFAINYHRSLRKKRQFNSLLDEVAGIGEKRKKNLLNCYNSINEIQHASEIELANVPGMNKTSARNLFIFLHRKGKAQD